MTLSIRSKVLLLSLTLLTIPYMGYEYVREMEHYLRVNLETSLEDTGKALASVLNERPALFQRTLMDTLCETEKLNAPFLTHPINLDGEINEWKRYLKGKSIYAEQHILQNIGEYSQNSLSFQHVVGKDHHYLYLLFIVRDDHVIYRDISLSRLDKSDHLQIVIQAPNQRLYHYVIVPQAAGWVNAYNVSDTDMYAYQAQTKNSIQGMWKETKEGYRLEVRIPLSLIGERVGFAIADIDETKHRNIKTIIGTAPIFNWDSQGRVLIPVEKIERIIRSLGEREGRRLWVLDKQQRVLAKSGQLQRDFPHSNLNALYSLLLSPTLAQNSQIIEEEKINSAFYGNANTRWHTLNKHTSIISSAHPIWSQKQVMGVLIVEESSNRIQILQRQAIAKLFNRTLIIFSIVTVLLLVFATRLSVRLHVLCHQAETAIDMNGRITTTQIGSQDKDEIGDLARSFSAMLEKLQQYNTYLEGMASKLSHELRTPIAVVRSSLDNLEQELTPQSASYIYIERAKEGLKRLNTIITRLSEATRLEQVLKNVEREPFELGQVLRSCIDAYRLVYPNQDFQSILTQTPIHLEGAPDLIAQMLDKLIANAVDFSTLNKSIIIKLEKKGQTVHLKIINCGKSLPTEMQERLFESMVSLRSQVDVNKHEPHLGLGLYMVRLIVIYHGGHVKADNNPDCPGAIFTVSLPISNVQSP